MNSQQTSSRRRFILASLILCPVLAAGQEFRGPISGFVFDSSSGSLRPVAGIAGGAHLGEPILTGLVFASVSPDGKRGIVVKDGQVWRLSGFSPLTLEPALGAIDHPEKIIWSRDSSTAVLYSPSSNLLQSIGPLGAGPVVDLSMLGPIDALAVNRTGERIAAGIGSAIYWIGSGAIPERAAEPGKSAALAFSEDGTRLYAANRGDRQILEIGETIRPFLGENDGVSDPVALASSADGKFLYVASGEHRTIQTYEISTRLAVGDSIPLDFAPSCFEPLSDPAVFRLNAPEAHTSLLIFDTRTGFNVFFVPPAAVGGAQ